MVLEIWEHLRNRLNPNRKGKVMWPNGHHHHYYDYYDSYGRHEYNDGECRHNMGNPTDNSPETQTVQVTFDTQSGKRLTKLLTVTEVSYGDELVEFWNDDKLLLMVRDTHLLEAFDVDEIVLGDE